MILEPKIGDYGVLISPLMGLVLVRISDIVKDGYIAAYVESLEPDKGYKIPEDFTFIRIEWLGTSFIVIGSNSKINKQTLRLLYGK